ncbi:MAG: FeoA family protein [Candidatus Omnitrophota bacterium]
MPLTKLGKGKKATIVELNAGRQGSHRLSSLGLRLGRHITKISSFALRGPVTVKAGSTTIALGHGMAEKVIVEFHA